MPLRSRRRACLFVDTPVQHYRAHPHKHILTHTLKELSRDVQSRSNLLFYCCPNLLFVSHMSDAPTTLSYYDMSRQNDFIVLLQDLIFFFVDYI